MSTNFVPTRESQLVDFSKNFDEKITATPTAYGLTAAQATAYTALHDAFTTAYDAVQDPVTRSPSNILAKNNAKFALIDGPGGIRALAAIVQATPSVTNVQKLDLGLTVRDSEPTPIPPPTSAPALEILNNAGRRVTLRLHDPEETTRRAKPEGVKGATVFTFVGDEPPTNVNQWQFNQNTTKPNRVTITFPESVSEGAKVWIAAFWFNPTSQSGPLSSAVSTRVIGGLLQQAA